MIEVTWMRMTIILKKKKKTTCICQIIAYTMINKANIKDEFQLTKNMKALSSLSHQNTRTANHGNV